MIPDIFKMVADTVKQITGQVIAIKEGTSGLANDKYHPIPEVEALRGNDIVFNADMATAAIRMNPERAMARKELEQKSTNSFFN